MRPETRQMTVAVVGGGPAGLMAAIAAARAGAGVTVFEKMPHPGTRLLATGGGHCNFTNTLGADDLMSRFGPHGRFIAPALNALDCSMLRTFMQDIGVPSHAPDGFHFFPVSNSAKDVRDALARTCRSLGVGIQTGKEVKRLVTEGGRMAGLMVGETPIAVSRVVVATGGASHSELGGGESGYELVRRAGHTITPLLPALTPLVTREAWPRRLAGVTMADAVIRIDLPGFVKRGQKGGLLFTHKGISGPPVLDISGDVAAVLARGDIVPLSINPLAGMSEAKWRTRFGDWRKSDGAKTVMALLCSVLPRSLVLVILELAQEEQLTRLSYLTREKEDLLTRFLSALPLTAASTGGFPDAMVTRGGVSLKEIRPETLESRLARGLFFAGEVVDLDGPCGGFNLQWAFSSGLLAGKSAAGTCGHPAGVHNMLE